MANSILVTGATGNVGGEVLKALTAHGQRAIAAVLEANLGAVAGIPARRFDFRNSATWGPALDGVDKLFLMRPPEMADVETTLIPLLQFAQAAGVEHVVFLSLFGVEKNKRIPHYAVEQAILSTGIPHTFVRPGFFMQNLSTSYRDDIRFRNEIFVPAGRGKLGFIDVRDIAAVAAKALCEEGHTGKAYSITGGAALDHDQVAQVLSQEMGRTITYVNPSFSAFRRRLEAQGKPPEYIAVMKSIYTPVRLRLAGGLTDELARLLGRPPITLEQFAQDFRAAWALPTEEEMADFQASNRVPSPPRSIIGTLLRSFIERSARKLDWPAIESRLASNGVVIAARMNAAADTPANRKQAAHVTGIERWGQTRIGILLGKPLVLDEYDGYRPDPALVMHDQAQAFQATRAATLALLGELRAAGVPLQAVAPHNDMGDVSLAGWFAYLDGHANREAGRIKAG